MGVGTDALKLTLTSTGPVNVLALPPLRLLGEMQPRVGAGVLGRVRAVGPALASARTATTNSTARVDL